MRLYLRNHRYWLAGIPGKKSCQALHRFLKLSFPVTDKETAELLLANYRMKEVRQELGIQVADPVPVKVFYLDYQRYCDRNKTLFTVQGDKYRLKRWLWFLREKRIDDVAKIGKQELTSFVSGLRSSNATINRYVALIQASMNWGVRQGYLKENSLKGYIKLQETRPFKPAEITAEDKEKIWTVEDKRFRLFLQVVYYTLARKSEVLNLLWSDVNLKKRTVTFRITKNKTVRVIPICDKFYEILRTNGVPEWTNGVHKIFPWEANYVTRKFNRLRKRLNLSIRGIHEFRHARASELLQAGVNPKAVQELLGHKTIAMTMEIYARINIEGLRKAVETL